MIVKKREPVLRFVTAADDLNSIDHIRSMVKKEGFYLFLRLTIGTTNGYGHLLEVYGLAIWQQNAEMFTLNPLHSFQELI